MKSYEERISEIDKAIDYYKGKLPREANPYATLIIAAFGSYYFISEEYFNTCGEESKFVCYEEEFEKRAKELGWVNGYKWGAEYETNGKKPDLPDYTVIEIECTKGKRDLGARLVRFNDWTRTKSFRIVDLSYEPKGESVDEIPASVLERVDNLRTKAEENQRIGDNQKEQKMNNDWYEKGELPPVGTECEYIVGKHKGYLRCTFVGLNSRGSIVIETVDGWYLTYHDHQIKFRPLQSETDKLVDEVEKY